MSDIIRNWLIARVGIILDLSAEYFGAHTRDGRLIATLLHSYDIINSDQLKTIVATENSRIALTNLQYISNWLRYIDIECSPSILRDIAHGKSSTALRLFYQLFLALESKDRLHFITQQKQRERFVPVNTKFDIKKVRETIQDTSEPSYNPLTQPLQNQTELIAWYRNKYNDIEAKLNAARTKHVETLSARNDSGAQSSAPRVTRPGPMPNDYEQFQAFVKKFEKKYKQKEHDWTYEELSTLMRRARAMKVPGVDLTQADKYIQSLRMKFRKNAADRKLKTKLETMLLNDLWGTVMEKQELEFDHLIASKTLKQSQYEKQMTAKCFEVRHQKQVFADNRRYVENLVMQKREDEFCRAVLDRQSDIDRVQYRFEFEKERNLELHRRLYAEKVRLKSEKHYNMCKEIVMVFMDVAVKTGLYHKQYNEEVPRHMIRSWKTLFISGRPIFEFVKKVETIMAPPDAPVEDIVHLERDRQDVMNDSDFQEYLLMHDPWNVRHLLPDYESPENPDYGLFVLGHIVHKLLGSKYPQPLPPEPPELPPFKVAACVTGISEFGQLPILQELLTKRSIHLIEMPNAVNYCLLAFQTEMIGIEEVEVHLEKETEMTLRGGGKDKQAVAAKPDPKAGKSVDMAREANKPKDVVPEYHGPVDVGVQTPRMIPIEDAIATMSEQAVLGRHAYELMALGETLNDHILCAMLVAYLKSLDKYKGWALINYPRTFEQAAILEMAITAKIVDKNVYGCMRLHDDVSVTQFLPRFPSDKSKSDDFPELQKSQLVPDPHAPPAPVVYTTFMTAWIILKHAPPNIDRTEETEILPDEASTIEDFYMDQGVNYTLYYNNFNFSVLKKLARMIIGDYTLPLKTSIQLFGDELENLEAQFGGGKAKPVKPPVGKKPQPSTLEEQSFVESEFEEEMEGETIIVLPGEPSYVYVDLHQSEPLQYGLATVWENIETIYVTDMKQLLFIKRIHRNTIVPYITYAKEHTNVFIARPDLKQEFVYKFQKMYNDLDDDLREDAEVQAELHCRLQEFRNKLWAICDVRMNEAEAERQRIINENWIADQMVLLCNLFVSIMQVEVDRCADTTQLVQDYYFIMLGKLLDTEERVQKLELIRVETIVKVEQDTAAEAMKSAHDLRLSKLPKPPKEYTPDGLVINARIAELLIVPEPHDLEATPFVSFVNSNLQLGLMQVDGWAVKAAKVIQDTQVAFNPAKAKKVPGEVDNSAEILRLFEEWMCAMDSEISRTKLRLRIIESKAIKDLNEILACAQTTFHGIYKRIAERYDKEIDSVAKICKVFALAFEERVRIQSQLVLVDDNMIVDEDTILYPHKPEPAISPATERILDGEFSISQLTNLYCIFYDVAPSGSVPERTLIFLLQDMLVHNAEDGRPSVVPVLWARMSPPDLEEVLNEMYGDTEYIDWRDFIVYNMAVAFPTEQQILKAWMTYGLFDEEHTELIHRDNYNKIRLWFERPPVKQHEHAPSDAESYVPSPDTPSSADEEIRARLTKELLFKMFEVKQDFVNYTGLLLAFCKDINPVVGMAKAFTLTLRSLISWDPQEGEEYEHSMGGSEFKDSNRSKGWSVTNSVLEEAMTCICGTTVISDYVEEEKSLRDYEVEETEELQPELEDPSLIGEEDVEEAKSFVSLSLAHAYSDEDLAMYKDRAYILPFETVLATLSATLPWHIRMQCIENQSLRHLLERVFADIAMETGVYAYKFFQHPTIQEIFLVCHKFHELYPPELVRKYITEQ